MRQAATEGNRGSRRSGLATVLLVGATVALSLGIALLASPASAETGKKALVLETSVSGGASSREAMRAVALGFTVDVVSEEAWAAKKASDFADYQLIIIGDPSCGDLPAVVSQNATALADAVMARAGGNGKAGNRVLVGTDPVFHDDQGGSKLVDAGVDFAGVQEGATGLYLSFTCGDDDYDGNGVGDGQDKLLPLLTVSTSNWTQSGGVCGDSVSLISNAAQFSALESSDLQSWGCSVHETFPTFPTDWTALAIATDSSTQPTCGTDVTTGERACGQAYILIAGSGIVAAAPNLSLTPSTATNPVGTAHTVTATVKDSEGAPASGVHVSFVVTGANAEAAGVCAPTTCDSGADGRVSFTYTGANLGDDTINASITLAGSTQTATAAKTWEAGEGGGSPPDPEPEPTPAPPAPPAPSPPPPPEISINDVDAVENGNATFTLRLDRIDSKRVTVDYGTADRTAHAPGDYTASSGTVAFEPGERTKSLVIPGSNDTTDEPDETFVVNLSNPSNGTIRHGTGTAFVQDDADPPPTVSVVDVRVVEGDLEGFMSLQATPTFAVFTLELSEPSGKVVTVDYSTADGTARGGTDYTPTSGTATFQPGQTRQTVAVPVAPDNQDEVDRSFFLRIGGGANNGGASDGEANATIQDDDDPPPPVAGQSGNGSVKEGEILVRLPGTDQFVPLTGPLQLPLGTVVDATRGTVILLMSDGKGGTYTGEFSGGIFTILEQKPGVLRAFSGSQAKKKPKAKKPKARRQTVLFTTLRLDGGDFDICSQPRMLSRDAAKKKPKAKPGPKPKTVRRLWGDSTGKFRTKGRHSAATVRGTRWLTSDRCDGTLTYVAQGGPVSVQDFVRGLTVELRKGQAYVARPRGRR